MKREIKFRAWIPTGAGTGDMVQPSTLQEMIYSKSNTFPMVMLKRIDFMQFTGLYDKNGREIYEGDVVRVQETMDGGRIVCLEAIATAVWNEERGCWGCEGEFSGHLADYALGTMLSLRGNCCEVIGNIYENPELMEVTDDEQ